MWGVEEGPLDRDSAAFKLRDGDQLDISNFRAIATDGACNLDALADSDKMPYQFLGDRLNFRNRTPGERAHVGESSRPRDRLGHSHVDCPAPPKTLPVAPRDPESSWRVPKVGGVYQGFENVTCT